jgi:hypothetical protein
MADNINPRADGTGTLGRIAARWAALFTKTTAFAYLADVPATQANHSQIYADASGILKKVDGGGVVTSLTGVTGPATSVDANVATYNGITGQIIKDSGTALTDLATAAALAAHTTDQANPHEVTFTQAGAEEAGVAAGLIADHVADADDPHSAAGYMDQTAADALYDEIGAAGAVQDNLDDHVGDTDNPHSVTIAQVGGTASTHTHDATGSNGPKLAQANTHQTPDTDTSTSALHHTLGTGASQAAAGNHTHALTAVSITGATEDTDPDDDDEAAIYSDDATANRKVTLANLKTYFQTDAPLSELDITGATADTDPDDADEAPIYSADATANRKVTLANLKTYFQTGLDFVDGPATHAASYVPQWNATPDSETLVEGFPITAAGKAIVNGANVAAQRTTLELGDSATKSVGTTSGTVCAGDDSRLANAQKIEIGVACSDETTDLTDGTAKVTFRMPCAVTLTGVRASLSTAATGSTLTTVDINEAGTTVLSTKITIDASEKTSTTAATPAVISDSALADDAEITIDIDAVGETTPGKGLKVWLIGTRA